jgi:hypothetical protein
MNFPHGETVQVLTAGTVADPYSGGTQESWDTPVEAEIVGVAVEPRPSGEPTQDARNAVTSGFTLYMPPATEITAQSRVRVRGEVYNVLGDPAEWRSPFSGWQPGIVVQVERQEG